MNKRQISFARRKAWKPRFISIDTLTFPTYARKALIASTVESERADEDMDGTNLSKPLSFFSGSVDHRNYLR